MTQKIAKKIKVSYDPKKLAPVISADTWDLHYNQLYDSYCSKYNKGDHSKYTEGGWKLHELYFEQLKPVHDSLPSGKASDLINQRFSSFSKFKDAFNEKAIEFKGSGWIYLSIDGKIKTIDLHEPKNDIALIIDLWEHSYIQSHGANRKKYINDIWKIIDWDVVSKRIDPETLNENTNLRHLINYINEEL